MSGPGVNPKDAIGAAKVPASCVSRQVLGEVALGMFEGGLNYGRHNYRVAPVRASIYFDAANRHLDSWYEGEDIDPRSGVHHVSKAISSLFVLRDAMLCNSWEDDRPPPAPAGWLDRLNEQAAALVQRTANPKAPFTAKNVTPRVEAIGGRGGCGGVATMQPHAPGTTFNSTPPQPVRRFNLSHTWDKPMTRADFDALLNGDRPPGMPDTLACLDFTYAELAEAIEIMWAELGPRAEDHPFVQKLERARDQIAAL